MVASQEFAPLVNTQKKLLIMTCTGTLPTCRCRGTAASTLTLHEITFL